MPDVDFVNEVYVKAWSFRTEVQNQFKRNEGKADSGTTDGTDIPSSLDNGLFSDVASSVKRD